MTGRGPVIGAVLLLAGCATAKPPAPVKAAAVAPAPIPTLVAHDVVVRVPVPVKEACVPRTLSPAPRYPDSDEALRDAGGAADRYQLLAAGRILRAKRLAVLERVIAACR